jgi:hypothetical protein
VSVKKLFSGDNYSLTRFCGPSTWDGNQHLQITVQNAEEHEADHAGISFISMNKVEVRELIRELQDFVNDTI